MSPEMLLPTKLRGLSKMQSGLHADTAETGLITKFRHICCGLPEAVF